MEVEGKLGNEERKKPLKFCMDPDEGTRYRNLNSRGLPGFGRGMRSAHVKGWFTQN